MLWVILTALSAALIVGALAFAFGLRRVVCFRRKDCCGRGCGCLFPVRAPASRTGARGAQK